MPVRPVEFTGTALVDFSMMMETVRNEPVFGFNKDIQCCRKMIVDIFNNVMTKLNYDSIWNP